MPTDNFQYSDSLLLVPLLILSFPNKSGHFRLVRKYIIEHFYDREVQIITDAPFAEHPM